MKGITPCLWFDTEAEEAAEHYTSIFPRSRIVGISRYGEAGPGAAGTVMTVAFELDGQSFVGLNGGPRFKPTEALSLQVPCASQEEVDFYWERLGEGGEHGPCGWVKDRYGYWWQVFPQRLTELIESDDPEVARRAMTAMRGMSRIDIAELEAAVAVPA